MSDDQTTDIRDFIPRSGEHMLVVGKTGSGKTAFVTQLLASMPVAPIVIYDTKEERKFAKLKASVIVRTIEDLLKNAKDPRFDYIVVRPPADIIHKPEKLDEYLVAHYDNLRGAPAFVDEADQWVAGNRGGQGFVSLLSRGRSRGITSIFATQRPAFIPRKMITEVSHSIIFRLEDKQDRKRIGDVIPGFDKMPIAPKHWFYSYSSADDQPTLHPPISLDKRFNTGAVDNDPLDTLAAKTVERVWL